MHMATHVLHGMILMKRKVHMVAQVAMMMMTLMLLSSVAYAVVELLVMAMVAVKIQMETFALMKMVLILI